MGAVLEGITRQKVRSTTKQARLKVNVVGGVDRGGHPVDGMRHGHPSSQLRIVFDIVHPVSKGFNDRVAFFLSKRQLCSFEEGGYRAFHWSKERPASACS